MKKTVVILPVNSEVEKHHVLELKNLLFNSENIVEFEDNIHYCFATSCINSYLNDVIYELQLNFPKKITIVNFHKTDNSLELINKTHLKLLSETNYNYFASFLFKDINNIKILHNMIDSISNNQNLGVVSFERKHDGKFKKLVFANLHFKEICIYKKVLTRDFAYYLYKNPNTKYPVFFELLFFIKLKLYYGKKNLMLSIY